MKNHTTFENLDAKVENLINQAPIPERIRVIARRRWHELKGQKLNIMVAGAT